MSDPRPIIRFVATYPGAQNENDVKLLGEHYRLAGPAWPNKTDEQSVHADQVVARKVGWNGGPIFEYTCPACGIRWRRE
jgi:hypothetical protein